MGSSPEKTFGSRLDNARKVLSNLVTFAAYPAGQVAYIPSQSSQSIASYTDLINAIVVQNSLTAGAIQAYTLAVDDRQNVFKKNEYSLEKMLSKINTAVNSAYGRGSKEAITLGALIAKIRGIKVKKDPKNPDALSVSRSERSYGSLTQKFSDLIASLGKNRGPYNPANPNIQFDELNNKLQILIQNNLAVAVAFMEVKKQRDARTVNYATLKDITQGIKDCLSSQYGIKSVEYRSVSSLVV